MKDSIILQDKKYISAKRAAVIFGYTSDYVGQMCREGKLECTMVGRSWFVNEESVLGHKLSMSEIPVSISSTPSAITEPVLISPIATEIPKKKINKLSLTFALCLLLFAIVLFGNNFLSYFSKTPKTFVASVMNGLVVSPSFNSELENEITKQNLRNPFSDEVNINSDSSGTAGVITPVFKESQGDNFLYVMVPVKDSKK